MRTAIRGFAAIAFWVQFAAPAVPSLIAIQDARIVTASGPVIEKGTVVIRDGLISAVGSDGAIPAGAWVIDGRGLTVYPGLIDALSNWGVPAPPSSGQSGGSGRGGPPSLAPSAPSPAGAPQPVIRGPEDRPQASTWVKAQDLVQPGDPRIADARNAGFTSAVVFPRSGIFAGQGALMNLAGEKAGAMTVASGLAQLVSFALRGTSSFPGSLMGIFAYIRQMDLDAEHYKKAHQMYAADPKGLKRPDYDRALEGYLQTPRLLLPASRAVEVERMIRFGAELKRPAVLYGGHESGKAAESLKRSGVPVLINLRWPERIRDADPDSRDSLRVLEMRDNAPAVPSALARAGVKFAFYSGGVERAADLRPAVRRAIISGLPAEDAVRALTLWPAQIYGVDNRTGSIETGKIANLVVADRDLFDDAARIRYVFIDGAKFEPPPPAQTSSDEEERRP
jgi:hypothetical protein